MFFLQVCSLESWRMLGISYLLSTVVKDKFCVYLLVDRDTGTLRQMYLDTDIVTYLLT